MRGLEEGVMWEAVTSCDNSYDGVFFYAVKTTKIFCRPSCKSRTPLKENVMYFPMFSVAIEQGFRPCKRCRPDLLEVPNEEAIIQVTQQIIEQESMSALPLDKLAKRVGMSKFHLQRLFKQKTKLSPLQYLTKMRMLKAAFLLESTEVSITDIALIVGYKSSAHFSVIFRKHFQCSPTEYRNRLSRKKELKPNELEG